MLAVLPGYVAHDAADVGKERAKRVNAMIRHDMWQTDGRGKRNRCDRISAVTAKLFGKRHQLPVEQQHRNHNAQQGKGGPRQPGDRPGAEILQHVHWQDVGQQASNRPSSGVGRG